MSIADEIIYGTKENVARYIQSDVDLNAIDEYGFTPLIQTVLVNRIELAELLLAKGVQVDKPDLTGRTALHWAADDNNLPFCKLLLSHHANPNTYTMAGEPILVNPLLRHQEELRELLMKAGGNLSFAQDFTNTKLIGHRYELQGEVDIVDNKEQFVEIEFSGFFPEFTIEIIRDSLSRYQNNFSARHLRVYFNNIQKMQRSFNVALAIIKYQRHLVDLKKYKTQIATLFSQELLFLPVCYAGHAVSFIKYKDFLVKCDRGENSTREGSVNIYQINRPDMFTKEFLYQLIYKRQTKEFVHGGINQFLGLTPVAKIPIETQITGNCSWANIDAAVCGMLFLLLYFDQGYDIKKCIDDAILFYCQWQEWDKDRALENCIQSMDYSSEARKASRATVLMAILFQACQFGVPADMARAGKILSVLSQPDYLPVLKTYVSIFVKDPNVTPGPHAKNLMQILDYFDVVAK